jgi:hypothetical protein
MRFPVSPLRLALPIALLAATLIASPAASFAPTLRTASLSGGSVQASVGGTIRTGAWKLVVRRPGVGQRLRVVIERGDIWWGGHVLVRQKGRDGWTTVERVSLERNGQLDRTVCAEALDACILRGSIRPPRPGAQRLEAAFQLRGGGNWRLVGSVRQASEPFILGPWIAAETERLSF